MVLRILKYLLIKLALINSFDGGAQTPCAEHLVLMASGINYIGSSALENLLAFNK